MTKQIMWKFDRLNHPTMNLLCVVVLVTSFLVLQLMPPTDAWQLNWSVGRRVITTKSGKLRGLVVKPNYPGAGRVDVFLGIPYAEPPRRFMPPKAPIPWNGVKLATKLSPVCMQNFPDIRNKSEALKQMPEGRYHFLQRLYPYLVNQSEDCLYLNVYAPHRDESAPDGATGPNGADMDTGVDVDAAYDDSSSPGRGYHQQQQRQSRRRQEELNPVLVFFHGESYDWNSGNPYDGTVLSSFGRVVVVTFNFRLGIFGFLRTGTSPTARANFGLWDQIAALEWIQENIRSFGGDPSNVTLIGHGTGAACINLLMTSAVTQQIKGLFHRVVLMSGSALAPWAMVPDPTSVTIQVGNMLNCVVEERRKEEYADCLRSRSAEDLVEASSRVMLPAFTTAFGPVVDGILIQTAPRRSIQNHIDAFSRYDVIQGVVPVESYFLFEDNDIRYGMDERRRNQLVDTFIKNNYIMKSEEILAAVMVDYTNWKKPENDRDSLRNTAMDIFTDAVYVAGQIELANLHAAENIRSYLYVFVHQSKFGDYPEKFGCIHGEDLPYLFGVPLEGPVGANHFQSNYTVPESFLSQMFMTYITNFAKTGDPNVPARYLIDPTSSRRFGDPKPKSRARLRSDRVVWPAYSLHNQRYMVLGLNMNANNMHYKSNEMALWLKLIPQLLRAGARSRAQAENKLIPSLEGGPSVPASNEDNYYPVRPRFPPPMPPQAPPPILRYEEESNEDDESKKHPLSGRRRFGYHGLQENGTEAGGSTFVAGTSTAWSLIIGGGICIIILNLCIFFGIYYQRDKIKTRARLLQKHCVLRAVNAGEELNSADARELEMLCEKSAKERRREAEKEKEKHKSQPNLSSAQITKAEIHIDDKTKSTPARIGQPSTSASSPNINAGSSKNVSIAKKSQKGPSKKQDKKEEPQYATVGKKARRTPSERKSLPLTTSSLTVKKEDVPDGAEFSPDQQKFATLSGTSPGRVPKRRKSQYDYQDADKDYYEWTKTPDPEDPSNVYKSSLTLKLADASSKTLPTPSSKRTKRRAETLADPVVLNPARLQQMQDPPTIHPYSAIPQEPLPPYNQPTMPVTQNAQQERRSTPNRSNSRGRSQLKRQKDIGRHSPGDYQMDQPQSMPNTATVDVNVTSLDEASGRDSRMASAGGWKQQEGDAVDSMKKLNYPKVLPDPSTPRQPTTMAPPLTSQRSSSSEYDDSQRRPAIRNHPTTFKPPAPPKQFSDSQPPALPPYQQPPAFPYPPPPEAIAEEPLPEAPPTPPGARGASSYLRSRRPEFSESFGTNSSVESQNSVVYAGERVVPGFSQSSSEEH